MTTILQLGLKEELTFALSFVKSKIISCELVIKPPPLSILITLIRFEILSGGFSVKKWGTSALGSREKRIGKVRGK